MQHNLVARDEIAHKKRVGDITVSHVEAAAQLFRHLAQMSPIAPAIVSRKRTHVMPLPQEQLRNMTANKSTGACYENLHTPHL